MTRSPRCKCGAYARSPISEVKCELTSATTSQNNIAPGRIGSYQALQDRPTLAIRCILGVEVEVLLRAMDQSQRDQHSAPVIEAHRPYGAEASVAHATAEEALIGKGPAGGNTPAASPPAQLLRSGHESPVDYSSTGTGATEAAPTGAHRFVAPADYLRLQSRAVGIGLGVVGGGSEGSGRPSTRHGVPMSSPLDREQIEGLVSGQRQTTLLYPPYFCRHVV